VLPAQQVSVDGQIVIMALTDFDVSANQHGQTGTISVFQLGISIDINRMISQTPGVETVPETITQRTYCPCIEEQLDSCLH
jgi:hypothetical protein